MPSVGTSPRRREGPEKVCGLAKYIDDYPLEGCLHGVTVRSASACGRLKGLRFDPSFPWSEFIVVTAKDIPGRNVVTLIDETQPLLAEGIVRHMHEPVAVIGHPDRARAYEALRHVTVEVEAEEPLLDIDVSLAGKTLVYGKDNVFKDILIEKGDLARGFAGAYRVVEGEYWVPHQEQAYIENNGMAAWVEPDGTIVVHGSMQCPYYIHKALKPVFDLPSEKIRVIQATTGGGFGGKEEYPNMLAGHAALLALKSKRPVKIVYDRAEDMAATTKRHPARVRHKTAVAKDGRLRAMDIEVVMDGGAYMTLSPVVISRGALHATGPYEVPHVRVAAKCVATNTPPNGAFRGFGAPQTLFAAELHMDRVAEALGMDPVALRRKNIFKVGSVTHTGQVLRESVGAGPVLERVVKRSGWAKKRRDYARWNKGARATWRGIGLAVTQHGGGFTGAGELYLASEAAVAVTREGFFRVLAANTEIGQGTNTMFSQIAADALGVPLERVSVEVPDTSKVPDSGPTVASRTCMVVGEIVRKAAVLAKDALRAAGADLTDERSLREAARRLCAGELQKTFIAKYEKPETMVWDEKNYKGDAYAAFSYGCVAADLEIDRLTYEVTIRKLYTAQDIGSVIHPLMAEGQVIGGLAQGVGWALLENAVYKGGAMTNASLTNYLIPTSVDTPPMEVDLLPAPYSGGPFGAKGVGELPMDPPGPAIAAAVAHALGAWPMRLPVLPELVMELAEAKR